jgi:hypothetical protein
MGISKKLPKGKTSSFLRGYAWCTREKEKIKKISPQKLTV